MLSKVSSEMMPASELRSVFSQRIRTTGFQHSNPNAIVKFSLFSNIVAHFDCASEAYSEVIAKALDSVSFFTNEGLHRFYEVDYIFADEDDRCVAVLKDGRDFLILHSASGKPLKGLEGLKVSTSMLKDYYLANQESFPYLNKMGDLLASMVENRSQLSNAMTKLANRCINNKWIEDNIFECIGELKALVTKSSFVLKD